MEHAQPEEQHGFRTNRRIGKDLLSAQMVIDKKLLANRPLWIPSSNLPKAFDRVDWDALWCGLHLYAVSAHVVWLLQIVYSNQMGQISGHTDGSREFCIKAGARTSNKDGSPFPESNPLCETKGCLQKLGVVQKRMLWSKTTSTMLMWYSENCFEVWSAHLLPQTGQDLGIKSCMIRMHG